MGRLPPITMADPFHSLGRLCRLGRRRPGWLGPAGWAAAGWLRRVDWLGGAAGWGGSGWLRRGGWAGGWGGAGGLRSPAGCAPAIPRSAATAPPPHVDHACPGPATHLGPLGDGRPRPSQPPAGHWDEPGALAVGKAIRLAENGDPGRRVGVPQRRIPVGRVGDRRPVPQRLDDVDQPGPGPREIEVDQRVRPGAIRPERKMTFSRLMSQWQMMSAGPSTNLVSSPSHCAPGGGSKPATAS